MSTPVSENSQVTPRSFFPALRIHAIVSFVLMVGATLLKQPPWVAMLGGVAPLVWYHLGYLAPRASKGLSHTAIDSVYYFGFLVTIAALGVSAVSLATGGAKESMDAIAFQFGLGLLATGYAVFARMHLTSIATWVDEQSPEALLDGYLTRTRELVTNVELASIQFSTLTANLVDRTQAVANSASETAEKRMLDMARVFNQQMVNTLASGNQSLLDLRSLVKETSFADEREALARSVKVTLEVVQHLNKALLEFCTHSSEGARSTQSVRLEADGLATSISQLNARLEQIAGDDGTLLRTAGSFDAVQTRALSATEALGGVVDELANIGGSLGGVGTTFKNLKSLTAKAQAQLDTLVASSSHLDQATEHISRSAERTSALADGLDRVASALPKMGERVNVVDNQLEQLGVTAGVVNKHLMSLPSPAETALGLTSDLRDAMTQLHKILATAGVEASALSGHASQTLMTLEQTRRLTADMTGLQEATHAVNTMLTSMTQNAARTTAALTTSSEALQTAVTTTANSLARDLQTSTRAASLFTERLSNVAQSIIDETRKVQAS